MSIGRATVTIEADASGFGSTASAEVTKALDGVAAEATSIFDTLELDAQGAFTGMGSAADAGAQAAAQAMGQVENAAGEADAALSGIDGDGFNRAAQAASQAATGVASSFTDEAGKADAALAGVTGDGFASATASAVSAAGDVSSNFVDSAGRADAALAGVDGDGFRSASAAGISAAGSIRDDMQQAASSVSRSWQGTSQDMQNAFGEAEQAASRVGQFAGAALGGTAAVLGLAGAGSIVNDAFAKNTSIEDTTAVLGVLTGSAEKAEATMDDLVESNMVTPIAFDRWAEAGKTLVAFGMDTEDVSDTVTALGEAAAASGSGADGLDRLSRAFGQAMATGTIQGDTLNQLMESGVPALDILGNHYGKTAEEMKKMASEGLPAEEAIAVLTEGIMEGTDGAAGSTAAFAGTMEELAGTTSGVLGNLGAAFINVASAAMDPFMNGLKGAGQWLTRVLYIGRDFINWLQDGGVAADIFVAALAVIGTMGTVAALAGIVTQLGLVAKITAGATKVWKLMNLAFLTTPVGMIITGLVALVAAFVVLWNNVEGFRDFWKGVWEGIKGAMEPVIDWITGAFDTVKDAWGELTSAFTSDEAVEGDALARLVGVDMANTILGTIQTVKGAWGELTSAFTSDEAVEGNALGHLIGIDAANEVLGFIQTAKGAWGELKAAFSGGDDGFGALAELIGMDAAEWVMDTITTVQDAWNGLTALLFEGDYTGALRNAFGIEEDDPIIGTILTFRDILTDIPDLITGITDILFKGDFTGLPFGLEEDGVVAGVFFGIRDAVIDTWGALQELWGILKEVGGQLAGSVWETAKTVFFALADVMVTVWEVGKSVAGAVWELVQALAPVLLPILKVVGAILGGVVVGAFFALMGALRLVAGLIGVVAKVIGWLSENILVPLIGIIADVVTWLADKLGGALSWVAELLGNVFSAIWPTIQGIWEGLQEGWANFVTWLGEAWAGLQEIWAEYGQPVVDFVVDAFQGLWDFLSLVGRLVGAAFEVAWTAIGKAWEAWGQPAVDWVMEAFGVMWDGIQVVLGWISTAWGFLWSGLQAVWSAVGQPVVDFVVWAFTSFWDGIQIIFGWVQDGWNTLWTGVQNLWAQYGQPVIDKVSYAFEWVKLQIERALWNIRNYIDLAGFKIRALWAEYVQPMIDNVTGGFTDLLDTIKGWKDNVIGWFSDAGSWLVDAGKNIIQGLIDGATSLLSNIGNFFLDVLPDWVKDPFKAALGIQSPSRVFMQYGEDIGAGLVAGIQSMDGAVQGATSELAMSAASAPMPDLSAPGGEGQPVGPVAGPVVPQVDASMVEGAAQASMAGAGQAWAVMAQDMAVVKEGVLDPTMMGTAQTMMDTSNQVGAQALMTSELVSTQATNTAGTVAHQSLGVMAPAWASMAGQMEATRAGVVQPTFNNLASGWTNTASTFPSQINGVVNPAWAGMGSHIQAVKANTIDPAFQGLQDGLGAVVGAFANGARDVGTHMENMRRATADPVRVTMNDIFSDGLVEMWNSVSDMIGTQKMNKKYAAFASGGVMSNAPYSPGRDNIRMFDPVHGHVLDLSGHEAVMRPEVTRALGTDTINQINAVARTGGVQAVGRYFEHMGGYASGGILPGGSYLGGFRPGGVIYGGNYGGLSPITASHAAWVGKHFPNIFTMTSGWRFTDSGHHSRGEASDWSNGGAAGTPEMKALARALYATFPNAAELIHWPLAGWQNHQHGRSMDFGAATNAEHRNHVHFATTAPLGDGMGAMTEVPINWDIDWRGMMENWVKDELASVDATASSYSAPGLVGGIPAGTWDGMREPALDAMATAMEESMKVMGGEGVEQWRPLAMQALSRHGYNPSDHIEAMLAQIDIESSGIPGNVNEWDANWLAGTPSKGLLQVIDPTYSRVRRAYPEAFEGLPDDILFPLTNLTAGVGAVRMDWGGPAGRWPTRDGYHKGGLMGEGQGIFHKTAMEPEMVLSPEQTQALLDWLAVPTSGSGAPQVHVMDVEAASGFTSELLDRLGIRSGAQPMTVGDNRGEGRARRIVQVTQNFYGQDDSQRAADNIIDALDRW